MPQLPQVGDQLPRRGNALTRAIGRLGLAIMRFGVEGQMPNEPKFVVIGAPHTSNWDFPVAMSVLFSLGIRVRWIGKHTLFRPPMGWFMRWLGGMPVDRRQPQGIVAQVVEWFNESEQFAIGLSPEGARRKVDSWRTGFYRIADGARVPIVLIKLDFGRRVVGIESFGVPSGDLDSDLAAIRSRYRGIQGLKPDQFDVV